jgi:hypothetical protein
MRTIAIFYRDMVLRPEPADAAGGVVGQIREQNAERVVLDGLRTLAARGIRATEGPRSPQYLPKLLTEYALAGDLRGRDLSNAMRQLIIAGKLRKTIIGRYGNNRNPMEGLEVVE